MITRREYEVLNQISLGYKIHEIAEQLYISTHTVVSHRKNLYSKLNVSNTASLVRYAFDYGILVPKNHESQSLTSNAA